jgi:hypothetical protein
MARNRVLILFLVTVLVVACHKKEVELLRFPYPYQAAFTICSDIDNTETLQEFITIQEYLCSHRQTSIGKGLGLPLGNSFWMDNELIKTGSNQDFSQTKLDYGISYNAALQDSLATVRKTIKSFLQKGWIDCLHSYGHFSETGFNRNLAQYFLQTMQQDSLFVDVFIDHGGPENLHSLGQRKHQLGDNPDSQVYHADITLEYGVKFLWDGQLSHSIGLSGDFSCENFLKTSLEAGQDWLNSNFSYQHNGEVAYPITLDDGSKVYRFVRYLNDRGHYDTADINFLDKQLNDKVLQKLLKNRGYLLYYTHLGANSGFPYLQENTKQQLHKIKQLYEQKKLWVASTSKLLNYFVVHKNLNWQATIQNDQVRIEIKESSDPVWGDYLPSLQQLRGLSFQVPKNSKVHIVAEDQPLPIKYHHNVLADYDFVTIGGE